MVRHAFHPGLEKHLLVGEAVQPLIIGRHRWLFRIQIGKVYYVDFRSGYAGLHDRIFWKRKSLSHESEVRAVVTQLEPKPERGLFVPVDLQLLLLGVVPSPFSPPWFADLVSRTMAHFGVRAVAEKSQLLAEPFF